MRYFACLVLLSCCALSGCTTIRGLDRLSLPETELAVTEHLERIIKPGMPVEEARQTLERYGFRCEYGEDVIMGIPYLYGVQVKERRVWPFRANWSTTIYHKYGFVTGVKGHYDLAIVERGIVVPPRRLDRFPAAAPKPGDKGGPAMVRKDTGTATKR